MAQFDTTYPHNTPNERVNHDSGNVVARNCILDTKKLEVQNSSIKCDCFKGLISFIQYMPSWRRGSE